VEDGAEHTLGSNEAGVPLFLGIGEGGGGTGAEDGPDYHNRIVGSGPHRRGWIRSRDPPGVWRTW